MNSFVAFLAASNSQQSSLLNLVPYLIMFGGVIALMILPQRKQRQRQAEFLSKLEVGSEVVTTGGIFGVINHLDGTVAHIEVDTDVVIRVLKSSLSAAPALASGDSSADSSSKKGR